MSKGAPNQSAGLSAPSVFSLCRLGGALLFSLLSLLPLSVTAQTNDDSATDELALLARAGLADFSLALLARDRPQLGSDPEAWVAWQHKRLAIFKQSGQWQRIIHEYETLPPEAPESYQAWLRLQVAAAYLAQGSGESARDLLLPLIWGDKERDRHALAQLRRLVIMSYLVEGRHSDAHSAMLRYEQDYGDSGDDSSWIALKARVLISDGQPDEAALVAVVSDDPGVKAVYTLARLKGYAAMDGQLLKDALAALNNMGLDQPLRQELFSAALKKAAAMESLADRIAALRQLLLAPEVSGARTTAAVDALWYAYGEYGQQVANRLQLLVGDFSPWFAAASELGSKTPVDAEALYVWLALHADSDEDKAKAQELFVSLISPQAQGGELLRILYLSSSQYTDISKLPLAVIYKLVDAALNGGDLAQATQLMSRLDAPQGVDLAEWQLRRARLQILTGSAREGADLLLQLVSSRQLTEAQITNLRSAIFDLQNGGHYQQADAVLTELLPRLPDLNLRREVLFWMADSRLARGDALEAARLYLSSAMLTAPDTMDPMAQAARFQAAQAMIKAGVVTDGVALYRSLLKVTEDPVRRALLQREIQRYQAPR